VDKDIRHLNHEKRREIGGWGGDRRYILKRSHILPALKVPGQCPPDLVEIRLKEDKRFGK
jgi:hypothetical protein